MIKWKYGFVLIAILLLLTACGKKLPIKTTMDESVNEFSFTNQDNQSVSLGDLEGKWWLADFVFTNCKTVCLPMTSNMANLQANLNNKGIELQLISFSVDPEYDTPDVLKAYGEQYEADFSSWHFLTGYDFETIRKLSIKSFKAMVKAPEYGDDQVMHDTRFFLVSPDGNVVKGYDGVDSKNIDEIMKDIITLENENLL